MKTLTPSKLREDIYRILDQVALKGKTVTVERKGVLLRIVPPEKKSRLSLLKKRKFIRGNPDDLPDIHWDKEWKPKPL